MAVVGNEDVLGRLVMRARALIENAGDGDWNRESAEWQLAAAKWRRDLEDVGAVPEPFVLEPEIGVEAAVMRTIGAASTCWTEIRNAGVFDSGRAEQIGVTFLGWLSDWIRTREPSEQDPEVTQRVTSDVVRYAESAGGYRDDVIQTAGHVWQEELDQERGPLTGSQPPEAQEPQETRAGLDLGDDPDGDIEGYDGPQGRRGGYCHGSEPWHPYGTVTGCCAFGGREAAPEPEGGPVQSFWPETPGSTP